MLYTIYAITKIIEETQIEASSKKEALSKAEKSPADYDWSESEELEVEYEAAEEYSRNWGHPSLFINTKSTNR